jgi:type I restriction enzyme, R subunit
MSFNGSTVEAAGLDWLKELGYPTAHGPYLAPGAHTTERDSFGDVLLGRLRVVIVRLNLYILRDARVDALRQATRSLF